MSHKEELMLLKETKTKSFCSKLDGLFDILIQNALVVMANDPDPATRGDRDFLIAQKLNEAGCFVLKYQISRRVLN